MTYADIVYTTLVIVVAFAALAIYVHTIFCGKDKR
jgi:hypothetical protein